MTSGINSWKAWYEEFGFAEASKDAPTNDR